MKWRVDVCDCVIVYKGNQHTAKDVIETVHTVHCAIHPMRAAKHHDAVLADCISTNVRLERDALKAGVPFEEFKQEWMAARGRSVT